MSDDPVAALALMGPHPAAALSGGEERESLVRPRPPSQRLLKRNRVEITWPLITGGGGGGGGGGRRLYTRPHVLLE